MLKTWCKLVIKLMSDGYFFQCKKKKTKKTKEKKKKKKEYYPLFPFSKRLVSPMHLLNYCWVEVNVISVTIIFFKIVWGFINRVNVIWSFVTGINLGWAIGRLISVFVHTFKNVQKYLKTKFFSFSDSSSFLSIDAILCLFLVAFIAPLQFSFCRIRFVQCQPLAYPILFFILVKTYGFLFAMPARHLIPLFLK